MGPRPEKVLSAIESLGMIGPEASEAIPMLEDWLRWGPRLSGPEGQQYVEASPSALEKIRGRWRPMAGFFRTHAGPVSR